MKKLILLIFVAVFGFGFVPRVDAPMSVTNVVIPTLATSVIPDGYSAPSDPALTNPFTAFTTYTINVSGVAHASVKLTGFQNLMDSIDNYVETVFMPDSMKLDTALTIGAVTWVQSVTRTNSNGAVTDSTMFLTGTETYNCSLKVQWK